MRPKLTYANVMSTIAVFLVVSGGAAYAASHLGKNSVGTKQLKKNSVTTAKIKKEAVTAAKVKRGTLTGTQIDASTLGTVPTAQRANTLAPGEDWHLVGGPGEPAFDNGWHDLSIPGKESPEAVAFAKDAEGYVHLRGGAAWGGSGATVFHLPPGFRPASNSFLNFPGICANCSPQALGIATIFGSNTEFHRDGAVLANTAGATTLGLDGITFRAES
jgi:hypothetical protein